MASPRVPALLALEVENRSTRPTADRCRNSRTHPQALTRESFMALIIVSATGQKPRSLEKNLCELCAFAPLRDTKPHGRVSRKGAKAQSSQRLLRESQILHYSRNDDQRLLYGARYGFKPILRVRARATVRRAGRSFRRRCGHSGTPLPL